jgi:UDP-galactopyranose mutase
MIDHPLIGLKLDTNYFDLKEEVKPRIATIYTGPIDRYFQYMEGKLEWRSLEFQFELKEQEWVQPNVQINYPNDHEYTRTVEIKHVTSQKHEQSIISKEYPRSKGEPYYPVPNEINRNRYQKYKLLAEKETDVYFVGRLAEYTYINTDEAVQRALKLFSELSLCHI